jgi:Arc/MetJ family transcription regulator
MNVIKIYTLPVTKRLIDVDDRFLEAARSELGTATIKETVNEALRRASSDREARISAALDVLAAAGLDDREDAWR